MDEHLNVTDTSARELLSQQTESENIEKTGNEQDVVFCEEILTSGRNKKHDDSDSDAVHSGSSDNDESNGFQKIRMSVGSTGTLDTEHDESNGFHKVKMEDGNASTPEHDLEDNDEIDGFQKVQIKDSNTDAIEPEFEEDSEMIVPGVSFQKQSAKENISLNDLEIKEPCYEREAAKTETLSRENYEETSTSTSHMIGSLWQEASEESILRHRIAPEPSRNDTNDNDDLRTRKHEDEIIPRGSKEKQKIALIRAALESDPVDIAALRMLAISPGGLINKNMRQQVWPLLIKANTTNITPKPSQEEMEAMTKTYSQVVMDVNRSSSRFPPGIDDHVRMSMKDKLVDLIMRVMLKHHQLKYYQGFHDVCITFLLCMDEDLAFAMVDKLAMGYMREYLDETMERTSLLLNFVYPLVNKCNPELCSHMERNDLGTIFALSWVITWFSHVLGDIKRILRVFDFFLASHRMMPVYLSAAFVLYRETDIYEVGDEMGYIHKCLSTIPSDLPLESLLQRAGDLYLQYPPTEISRDPMLIRMNRQVFEHFTRIDNRNASRRMAQQVNDRGRLFVKATMWTVTAVVGVAVAVLYHSYMGQSWSDIWSSFS